MLKYSSLFPEVGKILRLKLGGSFGLGLFIFYFPSGLDSKVSACSEGDQGSIPALGRSPGEGNGNHFSILAWEIPWTEEPERLQFMGLQ